LKFISVACARGVRRFLADRPLRLLVPVVIFGIAIAPWLEHVKRSASPVEWSRRAD
jgi:hypothetical protein